MIFYVQRKINSYEIKFVNNKKVIGVSQCCISYSGYSYALMSRIWNSDSLLVESFSLLLILSTTYAQRKMSSI